MKFISTQQKFNQSLSVVEKIIARNLILPILQNTLITCNQESGRVHLCSTDLEMGVEISIPVRIEEAGSVAVPTKLLTSLVKSFPNENVEFFEKNKKVTINCGNYKSNIKSEDSNDFPIIPNPEDTNGFTMSASRFLEGISSVISSASLLDIKPEISGVYVECDGKNICFAATDSFRLAEKQISYEGDEITKTRFILPRAVGDAIIRIFQIINDDISICATDNQIGIKNNPRDSFSPSVRFVGRVLSGDYPNYKEIIPRSFSTTIDVPKEEFIQRVRTASLFSNKIKEIAIQTNNKRQELEVLANNQEYGDYSSTIPCNISGEGERIVFNYQYLLDGVQNIHSHNILIKLNKSTTPVLIEPQENEGFRYLIMPIKSQ